MLKHAKRHIKILLLPLLVKFTDRVNVYDERKNKIKPLITIIYPSKFKNSSLKNVIII